MQIELTTLPHQKRAIKSIVDIFEDIANAGKIIKNEKHPHANPLLDKAYIETKVIPCITKIQQKNSIQPNMRNVSFAQNDSPLVIDIKMETGTGKTCVYTELMMALNKHYGFNKFLIVVPTTAIREGTKNFIQSDSARDYLRKDYENTEINLTVFESQKKQNKKNKYFPSAVREYFNGNILLNNKIYTLLIGQGMLKDKCAMGYDFEQSLLDEYTKPCDAIAHTKPIVIIDEPHRFKKDNKTFEYIKDKLNPQIIFRFGATFPDIKTKNGIVKDYENLIYDINAAKAFNDTLIKGVVSENVGVIKDNPIKIIEVSNKKGCQYVKFDKDNTKNYVIGEDLSPLNNNLLGIAIEKIDKDEERSNNITVEFSNGLKLTKGENLYPETFGENYQIIMIKAALTRHFETELVNVKRDDKIKTLCLFFIDSISSYRDIKASNKKGWLRLKFEEILKEYLKQQIEKVDTEISLGYDLQEYKKYLQASIDNITETNGGYFAQDWGEPDSSAIMDEVQDILHKERTLSFKKENGTWNLRRFFFSKWTLREGWDNPNVFTIAKLRSSGSEISKLQEVGRGLRLPVDVDGNRKKEQFYLNYIVDASEKEFAQKLITQVNGEVIGQIDIRKFVEDYSEQIAENSVIMLGDIARDGFIDNNYVLNLEKFDEFSDKYPALAQKIQESSQFDKGLQCNKIIDRNKSKDKDKVKIRPERFNELKDLWEILNRKYYVKFENIPENLIIEHIVDSINELKNTINEIATTRTKTVANNNEINLEGLEGQTFINTNKLEYNNVLKRVSKDTNIPIYVLHKGFIKFHEQNPDKDIKSMLNENFVQKLIYSCKDWMKESISKYSYEKLNVQKKDTALTYSNGKVKESVIKADIGIKMLDNFTTPDTFLYEELRYDSELEKDNLKASSQKEIIVFGKIPRRSIKIPTYFGETYSPDFMYVLKNNDSVKKLCCIVETKNVKSDNDKRQVENEKIKCAKKFYEKLQTDLKDENIEIYYKEQKTNDTITQIIHELTQNNN